MCAAFLSRESRGTAFFALHASKRRARAIAPFVRSRALLAFQRARLPRARRRAARRHVRAASGRLAACAAVFVEAESLENSCGPSNVQGSLFFWPAARQEPRAPRQRRANSQLLASRIAPLPRSCYLRLAAHKGCGTFASRRRRCPARSRSRPQAARRERRQRTQRCLTTYCIDCDWAPRYSAATHSSIGDALFVAFARLPQAAPPPCAQSCTRGVGRQTEGSVSSLSRRGVLQGAPHRRAHHKEMDASMASDIETALSSALVVVNA